ncbi:hypothetical protein ACWDA3_28090 [Nonomuraea rubra]
MSTVTNAASQGTTPGGGTRTAVTAAALVGAIASGGYIAGLFLLSGLTSAEAQRAPITIAECLLAGAAYLVLATTLGGLAGAGRLPRWALTFAATGCGLIAIQAWSYGSIIPDLARLLPSQQYADLSDQLVLAQLVFVPMGVVCLAGFSTLAVIGWRRKAMSKGAGVLLILAGLASLLGPFPPVGLLGGLALAWAARSARPADTALPAGATRAHK